ncbi:MAG: dihydropteroate synthase [Woeseia sp.]
MHLRLGSRTLNLDRPRVMGVINVTPDSFSDGGRFLDVDAAVSRAGRMQAAGADIIDIGGESTRPGAESVPEGEELDRVIPVIEAIAGRGDVVISVDTSKPAVMRAAVDAGAAMINDVCALTRDGALESASALDVGVCLMHMQGEPRTMQQNPAYERFPGDILAYLSGRVAACREAGIEAERIVIDPGFGFGKTHEHNVRLLADLDRFKALGMPLLVGLSRKSTLGHLTGKGLDDRLSSGVAAAVMAVERGANIVRTHDVGATVDALRIVDAVMQSGREQ